MTSRRAFLKSSGALVIAFSLDGFAQAPAAPSLPGSLAGNRMLNAWLRIDPIFAPLRGNPRFERMIK